MIRKILYLSLFIPFVSGQNVDTLDDVKMCIQKNLSLPWRVDAPFSIVNWQFRNTTSSPPLTIMTLTNGNLVIDTGYLNRLSYLNASNSVGMFLLDFTSSDVGFYQVNIVPSSSYDIVNITASAAIICPVDDPNLNFIEVGGKNITDTEIIVSRVDKIEVYSAAEYSRIVRKNGTMICEDNGTWSCPVNILQEEMSVLITVYTISMDNTISYYITFMVPAETTTVPAETTTVPAEATTDTNTGNTPGLLSCDPCFYATVIIHPVCLGICIIIWVVAVTKVISILHIAGSAVTGGIVVITTIVISSITCPDDEHCDLHIGLGVSVAVVIIVLAVILYFCCLKKKKKRERRDTIDSTKMAAQPESRDNLGDAKLQKKGGKKKQEKSDNSDDLEIHENSQYV